MKAKVTKDYKIELKYSEHFGYSVLLNDEVILECASFDELKDTTVEEFIGFYEDTVRPGNEREGLTNDFERLVNEAYPYDGINAREVAIDLTDEELKEQIELLEEMIGA